MSKQLDSTKAIDTKARSSSDAGRKAPPAAAPKGSFAGGAKPSKLPADFFAWANDANVLQRKPLGTVSFDVNRAGYATPQISPEIVKSLGLGAFLKLYEFEVCCVKVLICCLARDF